jgi:hypothetical protein
VIRTYASPLAFKEALETRLRARALQEGQIVNRLRQTVVMERFLVRVVGEFGDSTILKGGLALELRLSAARATRDIDLGILARPDNLLPRLQVSARVETGDFLSYEVAPDTEHPVIEADGLPYEGMRFAVKAFLAGRPYGGPFGLDVVLAEPCFGTPELLPGSETLGFIGLPRPIFPSTPIVAHIAEKLHAYTFPRPQPNSRVKDLPDVALLASIGGLDGSALGDAVRTTFQRRGTHLVPSAVPVPPAGWAGPYERIARLNRLPWADLAAVTSAVSRFLDPVLAGRDGTWDPTVWQWHAMDVRTRSVEREVDQL